MLKIFGYTIQKANSNSQKEANCGAMKSPHVIKPNHELRGDSPIICAIHKGQGGAAIEFRNYNPLTDRTTTSLYIVSDKENFIESLAGALQLEYLKL